MQDEPRTRETDTVASTAPEEVDALRAELAAAREELSSVRDNAVHEWLAVMDSESRVLGQVYNTVSWKVTWPLRAARKYQIAVRTHGIVPASRAAGGVVVRRLRRGR